MRRKLYADDTFEHAGHSFRIWIENDPDLREPWKEHDGHGIISDWTNRDKAPGERILCSDRRSHRYYDVQATMLLAVKDGWGIGPEKESHLADRLGRKPTKKEITAAAVDADFERMRGWCDDTWTWVWVRVTLLDADQETDYSASLGGLESDSEEYISNDVASELADECLYQVAEAEKTEALATHAEVIL